MRSFRLLDSMEPLSFGKGHMDWSLNPAGTFDMVSGELLLEQLVLKTIFVDRRFGRFGSRIRTSLGEKDLEVKGGMLNFFTQEAMVSLKKILDDYNKVYDLAPEETINQVLRVRVTQGQNPTEFEILLDLINGQVEVVSLNTKM